ncbi:MAG: CPBP family intramembrane metalloprotease [Ignavibacteriae bacterium]|nr:CPBP family intramembrane metalloprotease [Ignavibacteriota bacterium]
MKYLFGEFKLLIEETKKLDFRTTYIFISVALIVYVSIVFASPNFYYEAFSRNKLNSRVYWFLTDGTLMFLIPVLSVKLILKQKLSDFGFRLGDVKFGVITSGLFFAVMLPIIWVVSANKEFASTYPQGGVVLKQEYGLLVAYELCILVYMLGWEFLWRGYMLFGLKQKLGYYTIFIQMIPFFILHKGKPEIELFGAIFAGIILGVQALRANSFIYAWVLHCAVMISIDTISVVRYNLNFYSIF